MTARSDIDTDEIRRRYAAGEGIKTLAADLGVAIDTVRTRIPEETRRAPGRRPRADIDTADIVRMHDTDGVSLREIATRYGVATSTITRRYNAAHA